MIDVSKFVIEESKPVRVIIPDLPKPETMTIPVQRYVDFQEFKVKKYISFLEMIQTPEPFRKFQYENTAREIQDYISKEVKKFIKIENIENPINGGLEIVGSVFIGKLKEKD